MPWSHKCKILVVFGGKKISFIAFDATSGWEGQLSTIIATLHVVLQKRKRLTIRDVFEGVIVCEGSKRSFGNAYCSGKSNNLIIIVNYMEFYLLIMYLHMYGSN